MDGGHGNRHLPGPVARELSGASVSGVAAEKRAGVAGNYVEGREPRPKRWLDHLTRKYGEWRTPAVAGRLRENFFHHARFEHRRELLLQPVLIADQPFIIQAQQVKNRGVR